MNICGDVSRSVDDIPSTPVFSGSSFCPNEEHHVFSTPTSMASKMHHTPSPALLNPLSDEDWSSRPRHAVLCPTLSLGSSSADSKLQAGIEVGWIDHLSGERRDATISVNKDKHRAILHITVPCATDDCRDADEHDQDDEDSLVYRIRISNILSLERPIVPVAENYHPSRCLSIRLKFPMEGRSNFDFYCSSYESREDVFGSIQSLLLPVPISLRRRDHNPSSGVIAPRSRFLEQRRPTRRLDYQQQQITNTVPSTSDPFTPVIEESSPMSGTTNFSSMDAGQRTPTDEGMELTLVDIGGEKTIVSSPTTDPNGVRIVSLVSGEISMPELKDEPSASIVMTRLPNKDDVEESLDVTLRNNSYTVTNAVSDMNMSSNTWFFGDVCALGLNDISAAFHELFGVGSSQSSDDDPCIEEILSSVSSFVGSDAATPTDTPKNDKIRNRATCVNSQANRWSRLKSEMSFAGVTDSTTRHMHHIQTTRSWDEQDFFTSVSTTGRQQPRRQQPRRSFIDQFKPYAIIDMFNTHVPSEIGDTDGDHLYYDSDPEHVRSRRNARSSRQAAAEKLNKKTIESHSLPSVKFPRGVLRNRTKTMSDEEILAVVDVMKEATIYLIWHPKPSASEASPSPKCVQAWIERGTYLLNQSFVQPKFMWKSVYEDKLATERKVNVHVERFDLLEISRIEEYPSEEMTHDRPLAKKPHCFSIVTRKDCFLFQARSVAEKVKIVFGLKMVVARLASLLMVRDMKAVEEFFEPVDASVPGRAPEWGTNNNDRKNSNSIINNDRKR